MKDCFVIIRSVGERTEDLCKYAIRQNGIPEEQIGIIKNVAPFSKALKEGYKLALEYSYTYTIFIDADMICLPGSLQKILQRAQEEEDFFFLNPTCYDFLTQTIYPNGPHTYVTKHLQEALDIDNSESKTLRPESYVVREMQARGYAIIQLDEPIAAHGFEQDYSDLFSAITNKVHKAGPLQLRQLHKTLNNHSNLTIKKMYKYIRENKVPVALNYKDTLKAFNKLGIDQKEPIHNLQKTYDTIVDHIERSSYSYQGYNQGVLRQTWKLFGNAFLRLFRKYSD